MSLVEVVPYDYVPFCKNVHEKRIFLLDVKLDLPMLIKIFSNLEKGSMIPLKNAISKFLYNDNTRFWISILEDTNSLPDCYEKSQFLEDALMEAYNKNDY